MILKIAQWMFLLLIVSLPLVRPFNVYLFRLQVPYTDFIFLAVVLFWLVAILKKQTAFKNDRFYIFLAFYALALTISSIFSTDPPKSFAKLLGEFYLFGLAVVTFNLVQETAFLKKVVFAWLTGTGLTILASLLGFVLFYLGYKTQEANYFLSHFGSLPVGNYPRIHALFANANMMCNFLNISVMFVILAKKLGWLKNFTAAVFLQIGVWFAAIFTFSTGLGGMVLSTALWYWALLATKQRQYLSRIVLAAGVVFATLVFASALFSPDTSNTDQEFKLPFTERKIEASVRVLVWEDAIRTFSQYPLLGKGTGTDAALVRYETLSSDKQLLRDAHNSWLNILAQTGIFGLIAFGAFFGYLFSRCRFRFDNEDEARLILVALSCAFAGTFLYQGLTGSYEDARHLWVLAGMIFAVSSFQNNSSVEPKNGTSEASK